MAGRGLARTGRSARARIARTGRRHTRRRRAGRQSPASTVPECSTDARCNTRPPFCSCGDLILLSNVSTPFSTVVHGSRAWSSAEKARRRNEASRRLSARASVWSVARVAKALRPAKHSCAGSWPRREETSLGRKSRCGLSKPAIARHSPPRHHRESARAAPGAKVPVGLTCADPSKGDSDRLRHPKQRTRAHPASARR
jgi:hypothetical protein